MRRCISIGLALGSLLATETAAQSLAEKMAVLSMPKFGENDRTVRRFEFLLPRLADVCTDMESEDEVADVLVVVYQQLQDAGLEGEEGLLDLTENLYKLTATFETIYRSARIDPPNKCRDPWASYVILRRERYSPDEARGSLVEIAMVLTQ